jgi:uncharacterized protein YdeI (YjbR/CyaY-like superfamily)
MSKRFQSQRGSRVKRFKAVLERLPSRLNWTIIRLPFDAVRFYGVRGQINVKGTINGFAFRTCLFPVKTGGHFLLVNKKMQKAAGARLSSIAEVCLEPDMERRVAAMPDPLKRIIRSDRSLLRWYHDELNQSTKNDIAKWIDEPKTHQARDRRAHQMAERLMAVMEAEHELPPILQRAFAANPQAREGWEKMSAPRRRAHLFGIFYYSTPESRARRIEKMMAEAEAKT